MEIRNNMEFVIKNGFLPNMYKSDRLKILEVTDSSIVIKMNNSGYRSVFPTDSFAYWVKRGYLVNLNDRLKSS